MNADPLAYRYEINDLKDRCRDTRLLYCVAKRNRRRRFADAVRALDEKDREENNPHTSGAPISPSKHLSARSRPMDRKKNAGKENEIKKMLWECEIRGRGVSSRTTAGASSSDS